MTKYEYKYVKQIKSQTPEGQPIFAQDIAEMVMNEAGKQGWEIVQILPDADGLTLCKRPVKKWWQIWKWNITIQKRASLRTQN